jgi:hypothetical protein
MSKAAELAALIGSQTAQGNKNLIINGAMQIAQRGTSSTGSSYQTVDRFFYSASSLDDHAFTQTQQAVTDLAGFTNSWRITTTTAESAIAADELVYVAQKIEAQNLQQLAYGTSSAKQVTLSFYVKSSITGTFSTNLYQVDDNRIVNSEYTISSADTWERKEITYAADQTGVIDNNNGSGLYVTWNLALGSNRKGNAASAWETQNTDNWGGAGTYTDAVITTVNSTWEITGVQLEIGEVATPFEHEDVGTTLAKCQRYYHQLVDGNTQAIGQGSYYSSGIWQVHVDFPTTMRATPDLIITAAADHYNISSGNTNDSVDGDDNIQTASTRACFLQFTTNVSGTQGNGGHVHSARSTSSVAFDAEL